MWVPALPADFNDCLCHSWRYLNTFKTRRMFRNPAAPGKHWEQPGLAHLLTWKTTTHAPGTWLVFVAEIHRKKKGKKKKSSDSKLGVASGRESRKKHLQGEQLGRGVSKGVACNSQLHKELSSAWQKPRGQCLCLCFREGGWKLGREKGSFCSLFSWGEIPLEEPEGNPTQTSTNEIKTLQNEPWNTNTAKSLLTRAPRSTTTGADGLVAALCPQAFPQPMHLRVCLFG